MRVGACTWIFGETPLEQVAETLSEIGYHGLELKGDLVAHSAARVRSTLRDSGLRPLAITPEDEDLAHPDARIRQRALHYYKNLIEFAHDIGCPVVSCHGAVGRVRALSSQDAEYGHLQESVAHLADAARPAGVRIAVETLNRYESHLLNTAEQALAFVGEIGDSSVGVLLDTYHMNIEEGAPEDAVRQAADRLFLFHVADSNRKGLGRGHINFRALFATLQEVGYSGDIIVECTASGPDPFTPVKGDGWEQELHLYLVESLHFLLSHLPQTGSND